MKGIVHTVHTMTIRQYSEYEAEKDLRLLLRRFRFLPAKWFLKEITEFTTEFNKLFNENGEDQIQKSTEQLLAFNKVQILRSLYEALQLHTSTKAQIDVMKKVAGMKPSDDPALAKYIEIAEEMTGIKITDLESLKYFFMEVERRVDKYNEKYAQKEVIKPGTNIIKLYLACCQTTEVTPGIDMTLWEFAQFKEVAEQRSRMIEQRMNKGNG